MSEHLQLWTLAINAAVTIIGSVCTVLVVYFRSRQTDRAVEDNTRMTAATGAVTIKHAEREGVNGPEMAAAKKAINGHAEPKP